MKPLHTLGLAIIGNSWSQHQHGKIPCVPTPLRRVSQNPVDGCNVPSYLGSLFRCTFLNVLSNSRHNSRELSPYRQKYVRPGCHSSYLSIFKVIDPTFVDVHRKRPRQLASRNVAFTSSCSYQGNRILRKWHNCTSDYLYLKYCIRKSGDGSP